MRNRIKHFLNILLISIIISLTFILIYNIGIKVGSMLNFIPLAYKFTFFV